MRRRIEDIMQREVVTVTPDTPVRELLRLLVDRQISGVPVISEEGEILGVVSQTDVVRLGAEEAVTPGGVPALNPLGLPPEEYDEESTAPFFLMTEEWSYPPPEEAGLLPEGLFDGFTAGDIMTPAAFTVTPRDTVEEVAKFLLQGRIHRALVVEGGQLLGIVTAFDLLRALVEG